MERYSTLSHRKTGFFFIIPPLFRNKKNILVSRSHCDLLMLLIINDVMNERYLSGKVSLIVFKAKKWNERYPQKE